MRRNASHNGNGEQVMLNLSWGGIGLSIPLVRPLIYKIQKQSLYHYPIDKNNPGICQIPGLFLSMG